MKPKRRGRATAGVLVAACVLAASAPAAARAAAPAVGGLPAFSGAGGGAPARMSAGPSGCANRAVTSDFHENLATQAILPLEQLPADAVSVPTWSGSFATDGMTYPFTMVGTDPSAGSATTHVPVEIIPLSLDFAGSGCVLSDSAMAADLEASPLFAPRRFPPA